MLYLDHTLLVANFRIIRRTVSGNLLPPVLLRRLTYDVIYAVSNRWLNKIHVSIIIRHTFKQL